MNLIYLSFAIFFFTVFPSIALLIDILFLSKIVEPTMLIKYIDLYYFINDSLLTMFFMGLLYSIYHLYKTNAVAKEKRNLWCAVLLGWNFISTPLFWFWYIYPYFKNKQRLKYAT